jgi:excisionase family DNA binding protein
MTRGPAGTVSVDEAARRLGIGRGLAYRSIANGSFPLPTIKVGRRVLVPEIPLERLLDPRLADTEQVDE